MFSFNLNDIGNGNCIIGGPMTNTNENICNILFIYEDVTPKIRNYPYNRTSVQDLLVDDTRVGGRINVILN